MAGKSDEATERLAEVGEMLKNARRDRFTVEELAARADVSSGLISQIERGKGNPSFATLTKLVRALGLSMASIFSEPMDASQMVVRKSMRPRLVMPKQGLVYELLTPQTGGLAMVRTEVPAKFDNRDDPFAHPGEECVHVASGSLLVAVGENEFELAEGDTIRFDSGVPHWWRNRTSKPVVLIGAFSEALHPVEAVPGHQALPKEPTKQSRSAKTARSRS